MYIYANNPDNRYIYIPNHPYMLHSVYACLVACNCEYLVYTRICVHIHNWSIPNYSKIISDEHRSFSRPGHKYA